jgi:hypothetical protein
MIVRKWPMIRLLVIILVVIGVMAVVDVATPEQTFVFLFLLIVIGP